MPYALFLASCSMGSPMFLLLLPDLMFPSPSLLSCLFLSASRIASCRDSPSIYLGYSSIELWDSLSVYVHCGIDCLAFQACDGWGEFWASLSGLHSSLTLVKLIMIGHCL